MDNIVNEETTWKYFFKQIFRTVYNYINRSNKSDKSLCSPDLSNTVTGSATNISMYPIYFEEETK